MGASGAGYAEPRGTTTVSSLGFITVFILFYTLGTTRSHLELFKKHRAARIDHYVIEVNKLIIRLEKVCSPFTHCNVPPHVDGLRFDVDAVLAVDFI